MSINRKKERLGKLALIVVSPIGIAASLYALVVYRNKEHKKDIRNTSCAVLALSIASLALECFTYAKGTDLINARQAAAKIEHQRDVDFLQNLKIDKASGFTNFMITVSKPSTFGERMYNFTVLPKGVVTNSPLPFVGQEITRSYGEQSLHDIAVENPRVAALLMKSGVAILVTKGDSELVISPKPSANNP